MWRIRILNMRVKHTQPRLTLNRTNRKKNGLIIALLSITGQSGQTTDESTNQLTKQTSWRSLDNFGPALLRMIIGGACVIFAKICSTKLLFFIFLKPNLDRYPGTLLSVLTNKYPWL